jgi:hypothetical protein
VLRRAPRNDHFVTLLLLIGNIITSPLLQLQKGAGSLVSFIKSYVRFTQLKRNDWAI